MIAGNSVSWTSWSSGNWVSRGNSSVSKIIYKNSTSKYVKITQIKLNIGQGITSSSYSYLSGSPASGSKEYRKYYPPTTAHNPNIVYIGKSTTDLSEYLSSNVINGQPIRNPGILGEGGSPGWFTSPSRGSTTFTGTITVGPREELTLLIFHTYSGSGVDETRTGHFICTGLSDGNEVNDEYVSIPGSVTITITNNNQTILYGSHSVINYEVSVTGVPSGYEKLVKGGGQVGPITATKTAPVNVTVTHPNYEGSLTASANYTIYCKLNPPTTSFNSSTGGITIGTSVIPTISEGSNPSGCYSHIQVDSGSGSWADVSTIPYTVSSGSSVSFRSYLSKEGYVDSDMSSQTNSVSVYYEPRDMTSNGFTYSFKSDGSDITSSTVAIPGKNLSVSWSSFMTSKNLGRFNRYTISLIDTSSNEVLKSVSGENDPSISSSDSFSINPEWAGKICQLKLECSCYYGGSYYGPQSSAVFESSTFLVGGKPEVSMIYPSTSIFTSCNKRVRLIFNVNNPSYLSDKGITNVTVRVITQSKDLSYSYNDLGSRLNFCSTLSEKPDILPSGSTIDFTLPESVTLSSGVVFQIKCSNEFIDGDWSDPIMTSYINTGNPSIVSSSGYFNPSRPLLESDMINIYNWVREVLKGYSNFKESAWENVKLPDQDEEGHYLVQEKPYNGSSGIVSLLKSVYDLVKVYSIPPESLRIDLNNIDIESSGSKVESGLPPFSYSESGKFIPIGNYFNYILYILKNML